MDRAALEDPEQARRSEVDAAEPGAAEVFARLRRDAGEAKHRVEGAAGGDDVVCGGAIFCADDHAAGNADDAGGAGPAIGGGDFPDRAPVLGQPFGEFADRSVEDFAFERAELVFPQLDSEFTVASADENAGRGRTIQNLHCTEVSRWGRAGEEALASLRAAVVPGGEIVLESTANGAWGSFYKEWQQAEETGYRRHFFPWWFEETYKSEAGQLFEMTAEEAELAKMNGLTPEQIAWRRRQWASLRGLAAQEFAEDAISCFRASGECVFELEAVDRALAAAGDPIEMRNNGRLRIWLPPQPGKKYVIGVDPAGGGVNGDYSCAQVIDQQWGTQCGELHGHFPLGELAKLLVELGEEYNRALLAVETNNHGHGVLAHLHLKNYLNLFTQQGKDGWNTSAWSRPRMIENMAAVLAEKPGLFRSERLWNECRTFVRLDNGKPGAAYGAHDDCVMAMAIALAVRNERSLKG